MLLCPDMINKIPVFVIILKSENYSDSVITNNFCCNQHISNRILGAVPSDTHCHLTPCMTRAVVCK